MEGTLRKAGPLPSSVDDQLTCDGPFVACNVDEDDVGVFRLGIGDRPWLS
jgi:hypothetical protein